MAVALIYTPNILQYDYGPDHPMKVVRLRLTVDLIRAYGILDQPGVFQHEPSPATREEALWFHTSEYLDVLTSLEQGLLPDQPLSSQWTRHGLGLGDNPIFPGVWSGSLLVAGGGLDGARLVATGKASVAFHIAGGLHHALPDRASGFCYLNDPVLAIQELVRRGLRVLYVDIDAHHGDGVQWAFYETDQVLTVSLHESGEFLFPGTGSVEETGRGSGQGYAVNLPFYPGTGDETFVWGFEALVPRLVEGFRPDILVTQLGVDTFASDPLTHLRLTTHGFVRMVQRFRDFGLPWLALGGGGYCVANVVRAWTLAFGIMAGVALADPLPPGMKEALLPWGLEGDTLRDPKSEPETPYCRIWAETQLRRLEQHVPLLRD